MSGTSESSGMSGSVGQGAPGWGFASGRVSDLIRTLCDEAVRRGVRIVAAEKRGHIFFDQGHVVHAEFGEDVGLGAVVEMLHAGMVEFRPCARPWPSQPSLFFTADKLLAATRPGAVHLITTGVRRKWDAAAAARGFSEPPPLPEIDAPGVPPASAAVPKSSAPASARSPSAGAKATPAPAREQQLPDSEQADLTERLVHTPELASALGVAASDLSRAVAAAVSRSTQSRSTEPPTAQRPSARTERNWPEPSAPVPSSSAVAAVTLPPRAASSSAVAAVTLPPRAASSSAVATVTLPPRAAGSSAVAARTLAPRVVTSGVVTSGVVTVAPNGVTRAPAGVTVAPTGVTAAPAGVTLATSTVVSGAVPSRPPPSSRPSTEAPSDAAGAELVERERSAPPPRPRPSTVWVERGARRAAPSPLEVASSGAASSRRFRRILPGVTPPPTSMVRVSARGVILAARGDASEQLASAAAFIHNQAKLIAADLGRHGRTAVHLRGGGLSLLVVKSEVNDIAAALGPTGRLRSLLRKVGLG